MCNTELRSVSQNFLGQKLYEHVSQIKHSPYKQGDWNEVVLSSILFNRAFEMGKVIKQKLSLILPPLIPWNYGRSKELEENESQPTSRELSCWGIPNTEGGRGIPNVQWEKVL